MRPHRRDDLACALGRVAAASRALRHFCEQEQLWPLYDLLKALREGKKDVVLLPVPTALAQRISDVRDSMIIHSEDIEQLGYNVHFAARAASIAPDSPARPRLEKLQVHRKAAFAKHRWLSGAWRPVAPHAPVELQHPISDAPVPDDDDEDIIKEIFRKFDKDNTGSLGTNVMFDAMRDLRGPRVTKEMVQSVIDSFDSHTHGFVALEEFYDIFEEVDNLVTNSEVEESKTIEPSSNDMVPLPATIIERIHWLNSNVILHKEMFIDIDKAQTFLLKFGEECALRVLMNIEAIYTPSVRLVPMDWLEEAFQRESDRPCHNPNWNERLYPPHTPPHHGRHDPFYDPEACTVEWDKDEAWNIFSSKGTLKTAAELNIDIWMLGKRIGMKNYYDASEEGYHESMKYDWMNGLSHKRRRRMADALAGLGA